MIIDRDKNPRKMIYYLGGIVINTLEKENTNEFAFLDIFHKVREREKISINLFTYTLDWLYLLGVITLDKNKIKKCF